MKKFFTIFFVTLGVIFLIILSIVGYLLMTSPTLKALFLDSKATTTTTTASTTKTSAPVVDKNPILNDKQEKALETFGIDPATVPSSITPAQEACFVKILGQTRVNEIKAGDTPTATEFFQAKSCI